MAKFAVHVRLRPIRFGFLVKPHDARSLLKSRLFVDRNLSERQG